MWNLDNNIDILPVIDVVPICMIEMQELIKSELMILNMVYNKIINSFMKMIRAILRTKTR